jgi:acyl-CoA reductase-like NAD-dependent aldehyde dehydrogenase
VTAAPHVVGAELGGKDAMLVLDGEELFGPIVSVVSIENATKASVSRTAVGS